MSKYGKWIGGGLGWAFGGPIGALLGFVFGSMLDNYQSVGVESHKTRPADFSVSLLVLAAAVIKADNKVMKSELNYIKGFMLQQFGPNETEEKLLLLRDLLKQDINVYEICTQIRQYMDYPSRLQLLHFLFGLANADSIVHQQELDVISSISNYLNISPPDYQSVQAMFVKDTTSAFKILEIEPNATDEELKKAYRRMALKYHPDRVSHLGEDVQKAAKEKFQTVNNAYEEIKKQRNLN